MEKIKQLSVALCLLVASVGPMACRTAEQREHREPGVVFELEGKVTAEFWELPIRPNQVAFSYLSIESSDSDLNSTNSNRHFFQTQFLTALASPVWEKPEFWLDLMNDESRSDLFRLYCMRAYFLRHVEVGQDLRSLSSHSGFVDFIKQCEIEILGGSSGPRSVEYDYGTDDVMFIRLTSNVDGAGIPISIAFDSDIDFVELFHVDKHEQMLEILHGNTNGGTFRVRSIAIY